MNELSSFHCEIKNILEQARGKARSAVNAAMVEAYWLIGRRTLWRKSKTVRSGQNMAKHF